MAVSGDEDSPVRQFIAACRATAAVVTEWAEQTTAATVEAFHKLATDPAIRAVMENWRIAVVWAWRDCECFCAKAHPDDIGVCDSHAVITRRLANGPDGDADVPLCAPCAVAQGVAELAQ